MNSRNKRSHNSNKIKHKSENVSQEPWQTLSIVYIKGKQKNWGNSQDVAKLGKCLFSFLVSMSGS